MLGGGESHASEPVASAIGVTEKLAQLTHLRGTDVRHSSLRRGRFRMILPTIPADLPKTGNGTRASLSKQAERLACQSVGAVSGNRCRLISRN